MECFSLGGGIVFSRPLWQRQLIIKMWPARRFIAAMTRWPLFGWLIKRILFEGDYLTFLPSEESLKKRQKVALPGVVIDHFIEKAGYRFQMNACICRDANKCADYPREIGCLFIGEAARGINPGLGREVSVEEAKALQRRSEQAGLISLVGKNRLDKVWLGVEPAARLLTVCRCCECCCLWTLLTVMSDSIAGMVHKMEGVEVAVTGACRGCGSCLSSCFMQALSLKEGKAVIDTESCRGCGRCVLRCPQEAIELTFQESDYFKRCLKVIARVEDRVDVSEGHGEPERQAPHSRPRK